MQCITLFELQFIGTFALNFVFDGLKVMLSVSSMCWHAPHLVSLHFVTWLGCRLSFKLNLSLVNIFFRLGGCLLLLMILMLSITLEIFGLCFSKGKVFLINGNTFGLYGLYVVTNANMFLLVSCALVVLSSVLGSSLALLIASVIKLGG